MGQSSPIVSAARNNRALDEAVHAIPLALFRPAPAVYWIDMLASAGLGWTSLVFAVVADRWSRAALLLIAVVALYRAVLFIHEITHRAGRDLTAFAFVWNALVGVPLLVPSFLYEGVHTDHHRQSCYGTEADPEYLPFGRRSPALIIGLTLAPLLAPLALVVRFGVLVPLCWALPAVRRLTAERWSALVINPRYVRRAPIGRAGRAEEAAACALLWLSVGLWWSGRIPASALWCWAAVSAAVSGINAIRTLTAHRYDHDSGELSMIEQLLDSCTITNRGRVFTRFAGACHALAAPVGLRYHALHHWIPTLPYHNLGRVHRVLVSTLRPDAPYRATVEPGFLPPLRDLLRRSRTRRR